MAPMIVIVEFYSISFLSHHPSHRKWVSFPFKPNTALLQLLLSSNTPPTSVLGHEILLPSIFSG